MTEQSTQANAGKSIETERTRFAAEDLRQITSLQDAMKMVQDTLGGVVDASEEIGDGFVMVEDKASLVNVPMILVQWAFAPGDFGEEYVIVRAVTERGDKCIITDGSTGIRDQLRDYESRSGRTGGMLVRRGLRVSEYNTDKNGQPLPANADPALVEGKGRTFYLNV